MNPVAAASSTRIALGVLDPAQLDEATRLLALGFAEEPGNLALYPDPATRQAVWEIGARRALRSSLRFGTIHCARIDGELAAVAIWHPPGVTTRAAAGLLRDAADWFANAPTIARSLPHAGTVVLRDAPEALAMVRERNRAVARASAGATWHLAFLATAPDHRGKGLARRLLERQLDRCDEDGAAAWLETTDPVNPPIYERFGFETVSHVVDAAWLPGYWVMRREPRGR